MRPLNHHHLPLLMLTFLAVPSFLRDPFGQRREENIPDVL